MDSSDGLTDTFMICFMTDLVIDGMTQRIL